MKLNGRRILITGAARRIGREIALLLGQHKTQIIVHYNRSEREAEQVVQDLRNAGSEATSIQADLSISREVIRLGDESLKLWGGIDILVNNASVYYVTPLQTATESQWNEMIDINLKAPFLLAQKIGLQMKANGLGRIINISDWAAKRPHEGYTPYCISKAGLVALTQALARELAPEVLVNTVAPGPILPPEDMTHQQLTQVIDQTPLARTGEPSDIARAVLYLVRDADFVTGIYLPVDGGRQIR
ncbi:MAG: SDR family oxidoreductase [Planctomycetota bacterium]|nr:SDR family oxidoreductase [Planctomycetota bacterium]